MTDPKPSTSPVADPSSAAGLIDLRSDHLRIVLDILREHLPADVKVWVFGSRADRTTRDSSDLDIALQDEGKLSHKLLDTLKDAFSDSTLPYTVDIIDLNRISSSFKQIVKSQRVPLTINKDRTKQHTPWNAPTSNTTQEEAPPTTPGRWHKLKIGDFAPFTYGKSLPVRKRNSEGSIPVYGSNGIVGYHDKPLTRSPTVIIGRKGSVGTVHYSPGPCWPIDTAFYIEGDDHELVRFKYYLLKSLHMGVFLCGGALGGGRVWWMSVEL